MIEILGIKYISDKEASKRYGRSQSWFQRRRHQKLLPSFCKIDKKGKVFYPLDETDKWFINNMEIVK